jgi:hypothetical protein
MRLGCILKEKYDKDIHERLLQLGVEDPYWEVFENGYETSIIDGGVRENTVTLNYTLDV